MAKVRIGYGTDFVVENEMVGIKTGTSSSELDLFGDLHATGIINTGVTTLTSYDGFFNSEVKLLKQTIDLNSESASLSDEIIIDGEVTVSTGTTITSGLEDLTVTDNFALPGISDDKPTVGATRYNENLASLEFYTGVEWRAVKSYVDSGNRGRGIIAGGYVGAGPGSSTSNIHYITIPTLGNSVHFGNLTDARGRGAACSSSTRGLIQRGQYINSIDYITIASLGDAIDFGDTGALPAGYRGSASSSTRGIWAGGYTPAPTNNINNIDYVEIATTGNGNDFGDLRGPRWNLSGLSSPIRGVFSGGYETPNSGPAIDGNPSRLIDLITIASLGNAVDFGKLTVNSMGRSGLSNNVRGVLAGGRNPGGRLDSIDYITIASTGNATPFGDLGVFREAPTASSTQVRGTFSGGRQPAYVNTIEYVTIASTGNANDFGDLLAPSGGWFNGAGCSDSHGGLGGF